MAGTDVTIIRRARTFGQPLKSVPLPLLLLAALVLARLACRVVAVDGGVVDTQSGLHMQRAWDNYVLMDGDLLAPFSVWSTGNVSPLLPLTLIGVGGGVALVGRWVKTRARAVLTPELVAGGVFCYFALTYISLKDPARRHRDTPMAPL